MRNIFIPCSIEQCALDLVNSASPDCRKPAPEDTSFGVGHTAIDHVKTSVHLHYVLQQACSRNRLLVSGPF